MSHRQTIDPRLIEFAQSDSQRKMAQAIVDHGGFRQAAKHLGVDHSTISKSMTLLRLSAAARGFSPEHDYTRPVPATHVAKGISSCYDKDGKLSQQWVKSDLRQELYNEMVKAAITTFAQDTVKPKQAPIGPRDVSTDVIPWIQVGDAHIGMLAHAAEVGENFDIKIGVRELCAAIDIIVSEMPPCERAVLNDLGDFTHYENFTATTEASGHTLDYDSRFPKMIEAYVEVMKYLVEKLLTRVQYLDVIINQGNHSRTNDVWMAILLRHAYGHTGRVHVLDNRNVFIGYRMGKTLVMVHHSDKCKPAQLPAVMTADFRKDFGETEFHYVDIGHVHHREVAQDYNGIVVESWNHLAAYDRWAHDAGYRSSKSISVVLRSKTYGEVGRRTLPIAEIRDRISATGVGLRPMKEAYSV